MTLLPHDYLEAVVRTLRDQDVRFAPGLTESEFTAAEEAHDFQFPPDLRSLLEHALPVGERFPDWRHPDSAFIADRLDWPADSMCFDVEHAGFWLPDWGPRPEALEAAWARARQAVRAAPFLIPVFVRRYLPAVPCSAGNPVFDDRPLARYSDTPGQCHALLGHRALSSTGIYTHVSVERVLSVPSPFESLPDAAG